MRIKKIWCGVVVTIMMMVLVSCGASQNGEKYIVEGKIAMTNEEYEKARKLFELGLKEEKGNKEYSELVKIAENFFKLKEMNEKLSFSEFENSVSEIENLEILVEYKEEFDKLANETKKNKEEFEKRKTDIDKIDKFKQQGELDKAKNLATTVIKKIDNNEKIKELLNKKIEEIEKIIEDASNKIKELDKAVEKVKYKGIRGTNEEGYDRLAKLKGKRMLHFMEISNESPKDYMYDLKTGDIYNFNQGDIYHINTGKKIFDGMKYEKELEAKKEAENKKKMDEIRAVSKELFKGLEYIKRNKYGVVTESLELGFSPTEEFVLASYSTYHVQRADGENGEIIEPKDITQEILAQGNLLGRGDTFDGSFAYMGSNLWTGYVSNSSNYYKCKMKKISKGKYEVTINGEKRIFTTKGAS